MTVVFIDGSRKFHGEFAKVICDKKKNELYVTESFIEHIYPLDLIKEVVLEK